MSGVVIDLNGIENGFDERFCCGISYGRWWGWDGVVCRWS